MRKNSLKSLKNAIPIFNAHKLFDQQHQVIKTLWIMIGLLVMINCMLFIGWKSVPLKQRVYLPPDLSQGATLKANVIPKNTVYAFGYQILTALNTWSESGRQDYLKNINAYKAYLSPKFRASLQADFEQRKQSGALNRARIMSGVSGDGYMPQEVTYLGNGTWRVNMALQIQETVNGAVVKNVIMNYPLLVQKVNESIQDNPWNLVIAGFYDAPHRIKTLV